MSNKQSKREASTVGGEIDPRRRPNCADLNDAQNANLSSLCSKKVNKLSCRCSGCETDDKFPVITSPSDAPLLNTAYDGSGGSLTTGTDSYWEVGLGNPSGPGSVLPAAWIPAFVFPSTAWVASPFSNANWISYFANADHSALGNVDAYFRYRFNLSSSANPATFAIAMDFYADNCVFEIYVNGQPQNVPPPSGDPYGNVGFKAGHQVHINLDNNWQRCNNELIVHVKSGTPLLGFLAQNAVRVKTDETGCDCPCDCTAVELPDIHPCISVAWGDSPCDCLETDDVEVLCITVCNCYSNVTFTNFSIGQIHVTDMAGSPVPNLPDGTPSIQVIPSGPICFGDVPPCKDKDHPGCVSRELVLYTRGAVGKNYRLSFSAICFSVCHQIQSEQCFTMKLCQD